MAGLDLAPFVPLVPARDEDPRGLDGERRGLPRGVVGRAVATRDQRSGLPDGPVVEAGSHGGDEREAGRRAAAARSW